MGSSEGRGLAASGAGLQNQQAAAFVDVGFGGQQSFLLHAGNVAAQPLFVDAHFAHQCVKAVAGAVADAGDVIAVFSFALAHQPRAHEEERHHAAHRQHELEQASENFADGAAQHEDGQQINPAHQPVAQAEHAARFFQQHEYADDSHIGNHQKNGNADPVPVDRTRRAVV